MMPRAASGNWTGLVVKEGPHYCLCFDIGIGNCNGDGRWWQAQRWGATALYTGLTTEGPPRPGPPLCVTGGGASFLTQTFYLKVVTDSDADFPLKFSLPALRRHILAHLKQSSQSFWQHAFI